MPYPDCLAPNYEEKSKTVGRAMYILAVRGQLALDGGAYYVLPRCIASRKAFPSVPAH
jgi:hypothetical protein